MKTSAERIRKLIEGSPRATELFQEVEKKLDNIIEKRRMGCTSAFISVPKEDRVELGLVASYYGRLCYNVEDVTPDDSDKVSYLIDIL